MSKKLNTANSEQLIYENGMLLVAVLGGIKLEGLDRMRATLKVQLQESARPPVRHNLDLYNDTQLEKFIRKCAERLEIGTSILSASLSELTEELENYRLEKLKEQEQDAKPNIKQMTLAEQENAISFLSSPELLQRTNDLIGQSGVIGEEVNRLLMYLIFTTRKLQKPLHVISLGASGTGKTYLQESVSKCIPPEEVVNITSLSDNAFYYFERKALSHKLIVIEDLDGAENALYPLRELQTKNKIVKTIVQKNSKGETKSTHLVVEGPVSVAGCTTWEQVYEDNANRCFLLYLDDGKEQDKRIMNYQRAMSAGQVDNYKQQEIQEFLQDIQRMIKPIKVVNPYADKLQLPESVFKPRRTNAHYLQFIEAVTLYNQYQREKCHDKETGEEYIEVTKEDIQEANKLLKEVLLRKSDELTGACRNYLQRLKAYLNKRKTYTNIEIRTHLRIKESTLRNYHKQLKELGYIRRNKDAKTKSFTYELLIRKDYEALQKGIDKALTTALKGK